jgi:DNA-binding NtrC family response regulator
MDAVVAHRPDVIVAVLRRECYGDFGVMQLLHRTVPGVPMIFVASDSTLKSERVMRDLRPFYYAVAPVDMDEIGTAVEAALARKGVGAR